MVFARRLEVAPEAPPPPARLGITASRKTGNSPQRNRSRRLVREAWRHLLADVPPGWEIVVNCRADTHAATAAAVAEALRTALGRLGALPPRAPTASPPPAEPPPPLA